MKDKIETPKPTKASQFFSGQYHALRNRFAGDPEKLANFDFFMECQHKVFSSFFLMMQPYIEWLKYQYWLILFFALVSIYYLTQPISIWFKLFTLYFIPFYIKRLFIYPVRDLYHRKNIGKIVIGIIFTSVMVSMWSPIAYYNTMNIGEITYLVKDCEGIEEYGGHVGDSGFWSAYQTLQTDYVDCYDNRESDFFLATPSDVKSCSRDMDCEDFAYMVIKCLAPLYNVTCVPDMTFHSDYKVPSSERVSSHVGVHCYRDSDGVDSNWFYLD